MNAGTLTAWLDDIANTSSRTGKEEILAKIIDDPFVQEALKFALNPFITFGLTPPRQAGEGKATFDLSTRHVWATLHALQTRRLTGGSAFETVRELMTTLDASSAELLWRILSKDLRAGFTANTVNKLRKDMIPSFKVMLAKPYEQKRIKTWPVAVEPKLDGYRLLARVAKNDVEFLSRTGKPFGALKHLEDRILAIADKARSSGIGLNWIGKEDNAFILDGEIVAKTFNDAGVVRRKEEEAHDTDFYVFDILPLEDFKRQEGAFATDYKTRREALERIIRHGGQPAIQLNRRYFANSHEEVVYYYDRFRERGLEGAVVKPLDGGYEFKRSFQWLKMKAEETEDLRIIGTFEGEGKYEGMLGGVIVDRKGVDVRVGGGFSDAQRKELWEAVKRDSDLILAEAATGQPQEGYEFHHRIAEIEYHEVTPDGSLRHPRFVRFRDDKTVAEFEEQEAA